MPKKILLVEDEKTLSEMYQTKLEREKFTVISVQNGGQALEKVKAEKPDLILLDIILPKTNGFDILAELKANSKLKKIPVIMLTNLGQEEDIKKGEKLGAKDYIVKANSTPAQVVDKVKKLL
ncbi:response regulator [Candidatus Parcubacteria bacterium]|nr:response regulator [Patescibacteria group bacterium]MBU4481876.1 response regulator [Patescibacteria group bacterium]MCG2686582.1 response regulator [Candidatus Parcubacteria bacterium]